MKGCRMAKPSLRDLRAIYKIARPLIEKIVEMIKSGMNDEEIRARIAEPGGVGQGLLDAVRERGAKIDGYIKNG